MSEILNSEKVEKIFMSCLFESDEEKVTYLPAPGITKNVGFHPGRIAEKRADIITMLNELPPEFHEETGGGMSFLNACNDKHGAQWTSFHQRMEQLFQLGIAIGKVDYCVPREMWSMFPGGMPYIVIHTECKDVEEVPVPTTV